MSIPSPLALLSWIIDTSLKGSVVIALIVVILAVAGLRLGARWRHSLWLIVLMRLAFPILPSSKLSIFNLVRFASPLFLRDRVTAEAGRMAGGFPETVWLRTEPLSRAGNTLVTLWIVGVVFVAVRLLVASFRLQRRVARATRRTPAEARLMPLLAESRRALRIRRPVRLVISDAVKTPALHGFVRPALLLPATIENFDESEVRHILLHELWHLRRLDVAINWVLSLVQAIHWFNPFVWFAVARIKEEREICCDELALSCLEEDERISYGRTILRLLEGFRTATPVPAVVGIVNHKQQMKRRLMMIAAFKKRPRFSLLFLAIVAFVGTIAFTDARGGEARVIRKMNPAACAMFGKLDQKVSGDLTNGSLGDLLNLVASKTGVVIKQSPDIGTSRAQQARFTVHATNVPAQMLLMETLTPFELMANANADGVTVEKGSGCTMMRHEMHRETSSVDGGAVRKEEVTVEMDRASAEADKKMHEAAMTEPAGPGEQRVMIRAHASGECKLSAEGKLHRDLTVHLDENGTATEGTLQLDIDAGPAK